MSITLIQVPEEFETRLFKNLLKFRGKEASRLLILENNLLSEAFQWGLTDEGYDFWSDVNKGLIPTIPTTITTSKLDVLIKEAEDRGFAERVWTEFGQIEPGFDHELCEDGDFYYRNIKVLEDGVWIKPINKQKKIKKIKESENNRKSMKAAIHTIIDELHSYYKSK